MRILLPLLVTAIFLAGCTHRVEVQQGNFVDEEMVARIKMNMTREQVLFALGTPLINDAFHPNRWDYVYLAGRAGDVNRVRGFTLEFEEDRLVRIDGDVTVVDDRVQLQVQAADQ